MYKYNEKLRTAKIEIIGSLLYVISFILIGALIALTLLKRGL